MRKVGILLALFCMAAPVAAQTSAAHDDGKAFATGVAAGVKDIADDANVPVNNLPGYNGANAPESTYLGNLPALDAAKTTAALGNEASALVINGSSTRPVVSATLVNGTVAPGEIISENANAYATGVGVDGSTGNCVALPPSTNAAGTYEAMCNQGEQLVPEPRSCNVTLQHNFTNANDYRCTRLAVGSGTTAPTGEVNSGCSAFVTAGCTMTLEASQIVHNVSGCVPAACFNVSFHSQVFRAVCSAPVTGAVTGTPWTHPISQQVYSATFEPVQSYAGSVVNASQCAGHAADPGCSAPVDTCTDAAPTTRIVGGTSITQSCWGWSRIYQCHKTITNSDCSALASNPACSYARTECLDEPQSGACKVENRIYTCPIPASTQAPAEYVCGGDLYCVGGDCEAVTREASDEFKDAVVGLESLAQVNREFSDIDFKLFKGNVMGCHKPIFGLVNCCAGKASGLIGVTAGFTALAGGPAAIAFLATPLLTALLCSAAEKEYDVRDRMGLCHTVGTYCSSSFLGICASRTTKACCFMSKLTRILQEQGRAQLGKSWGPPKTPDCSGFNIDEFAALDLSQMDFSEVYKDFIDAAKLPDEAAAMTDIQAKIHAYYSNGGPPAP